ncbi:MAG: pyruvate, phosphate dikinase [Holophagales bacterium]|jgi:pyruvate,orthophosphate dikinase|nr:pyruvate, phosphate dikinase [Holophagales bacterium]
MTKYVYSFGGDRNEGNSSMRNTLGGKGSNLAEMASLGVPVPPGFTVITDVCSMYNQAGKTLSAGVVEQIREALGWLEKNQGRKLGDTEKPLLLSVRSGARDSMPGMMDTILNLGLNDQTVEGLAKASNNPRFAYDSYRRFIMMYSDVVLDVHKDHFEEKIDELKHKTGKKLDTEITADEWKSLCAEFKTIVKAKRGSDFPQDPWEQLLGGVCAVFNSWDTERAIIYRRMNHIPDEWGTAVNVQTMVFGNMGDDCGTGVAFTRDPGTGESYFYGEYLIDAQGEDVVAGVRTPQPITKYQAKDSGLKSLEEAMPSVYKELFDTCQKLEKHFKDMQDLEFTIQQGKLYMLQTRNGKRTALASIRIALDMVKEGMIDEIKALKRIKADDLTQLLAPIFNNSEKETFKKAGKLMTKGLPAGPGAATGIIALSAEEAQELSEKGPVVLVRLETSPEDLAGMVAAKGILTGRGGMTSHAAVVARGMGKPCVCGASALAIDTVKRTVSVDGVTLKAGEDYISIDGSAGEVYAGKLSAFPSEVNQVLIDKTIKPDQSETYQRFATIMSWANKHRTMKVRTNADTPNDSTVARAFGAEGIGLCRTEHMFFEGDRIIAVREMILANDVQGRKTALAKLLPMQRKDFEGIFEAMNGLPVNIRLIDPPLHEFVPHDEKGQAEMAKVLGLSLDEVRHRVEKLHEFNPMMGHRGCRLGITYPEIIRMQMRAIAEAAINVEKKGIKAIPEVMVPLIGTVKELTYTKTEMIAEINEINKEQGTNFSCQIGTMIEIPRAAITADQVAHEADYFSFGTNDLTQMGFGFSRDDAGNFLSEYVSKKILEDDPFQTLDQQGIGELVRIACEKGRSVKSDLKLGVCGEHGGDPRSVKFFFKCGLNYVSCSPFRVPIAIVAAAQASLEQK